MKANKKEIRKAEKRKMEQIRRKKKTKNIVLAVSLVTVVVMSFVIYISMPHDPIDNNQDADPAIPSDVVSQTEVRIPTSDISSNAKFYSYSVDGVDIRYFAVEGSDNNIHVALDACDVCYHEKKGYKQVNDVMQCINCGLVFPINDIGTANTGGGCWPSRLPINIDGDDVIIGISDLEAKRYMF